MNNKTDLQAICIKAVLTVRETALYMGICEKTLYNLMCKRAIPYYRGKGGKKAYFKREEVENYLLNTPIKSNAQIEKDTREYICKM